MEQKSLFGTTGIRGDAKSLFTDQFAFDLGLSFAQFLEIHQQEGGIAVGHDPRESSERIQTALLSGLSQSGRNLFIEGIVPVSAMAWLLNSTDLAGTIMVTGSHIKAEANGLKFFAFKEEILKEHEAEISAIYYQIKEKKIFQNNQLNLQIENRASNLYQKMLIDLAILKDKPLKVVVDPGNGAQSLIAPQVLKDVGCEVISINVNPVPEKFIARDTESGDAYQETQKIVLQEKADLGLVFDADGDRLILIDEIGNFIPGDYSGSLIAKYADSKKIVTPINVSQVVDNIGKEIIRTKVGSPFVVQAMKENQSGFGFEANGGCISAELMLTRDGGSTAVKIINLIRSNQKSLSQLLSELPKFFIFRTKVDCPIDLNQLIMDKAKTVFHGKIEDIDGLKIWIDSNTWILFRPSNNAPEFRVFAEAKAPDVAEKLGKTGIDFVNQMIKDNS